MRITVVSLFYPPSHGGAQAAAAFGAEALAADHDVTVVCSNHETGRAEEVRGGIRIVRCARQAMVARQPISFGLAAAVVGSRPDLIHFHAPNFWAAAAIALLLPRVPLIVTHHLDVEGRRLLKAPLLPIYRRLARRAASVITSAERNRQAFTDLPAGLQRVAAIPFPVEPAQFARSPKRLAELRAERRARYGDAVLAGFLGRMVWYKGLDILLEAMPDQQGMRLLLAGDGPLRQRFERKVEAMGLGGRVTFLGAIDDEARADFLATIDFLVFPSTHKTETFGIAQAEAQHCGKPVIATSLPTGASSIVLDGETGLLVPPGDSVALASAIRRLASDSDLRAQMGAAARRHASRFDRARFDAAIRAEVADALAAPAVRPRVLFLTQATEFVGGAERSLVDLSHNPDVEAEIALPGPGPLADAFAGKPVHHLDFGAVARIRRPLGPLRVLGAAAALLDTALRLRALSRERGIGLIHANGLKSHWVAVTARWLGGPPVVLRYHDIAHRRSERLLWRMAGRLAQGVVLVSRACWPGRKLPQHVSVIHCGMASADVVRPEPAGETIRLGFAGRIHPWKGLERLLDWMRSGVDAGFDLHLAVRGRFADDPAGYQERIEAMIERLGLGGRVRFDGFVEGEAVYAGIDIACVPSTLPDPLPRAVLEAQARGLFVVASPGGGMGDMIAHGETGWLAEDAAGFVAALRLSPEERATIAERGRTICRTRFSLDRMYRTYGNLYRRTIAARPRRRWQGSSDSNRGPSVLETDALTN